MLNFVIKNNMIERFWESENGEITDYINKAIFSDMRILDIVNGSNEYEEWNEIKYNLYHHNFTILENLFADNGVYITLNLKISYTKEVYYSKRELDELLKYEYNYLKAQRPKERGVHYTEKVIKIETKNYTIYREE